MNNAFSRILLTMLLLICGMVCHAQDTVVQHIEKRYNIYFRINSAEIEGDFSSNSHTLETLREDISRTLEKEGALPDSLLILSSASPDGHFEFNKRLAQRRAANTKRLILDMFPEFKDATIEVEYLEEDWDGLLQVLKAHPEFPQREEMMQVIQDDCNLQSKELNLRALKDGWTYLVDNYVYSLRNSSITITVAMTETNADDEFVRNVPTEKQIPAVSYSYFPEFNATGHSLAYMASSPAKPFGQKHLYVKTNTLGLALAISNLGCEIDIAKHLSIHVPVYYSALNYFTETIKFRTLAIQPELRYWTNKNNKGLFFGIHGSVAQYNLAVDGDLRYQDHDGTSPAVGGGIGLGYRMPISDDNRWHIEFALGAGVYKLHYDTFHNVHNGKLIDTYHDVYFGLDNAAINISYRFDLKKRKK